MKRRNGLLYALAASLLLHGGLAATAWRWPSLFSSPAKPKPAPQTEETILIPVEIHQFYADQKGKPAEDPAPIKEAAAFGSGWMKKIPAAPVATDEVTYASYIRDLILRQLVYPHDKKGEGIEVAVHVVFTLNAHGSLLSLEIPPDLRSPHESFNEAALAAVRRAAAQFPPFPAAVAKKEQRFSFLLLFRPNMN